MTQRKAARTGLVLLGLLGMAFAAALLAGCAGSMTKAMQAVGLDKGAGNNDSAKTLKLPLHVFAGTNLNAGSTDKAVALVVKIYHLHALERFQQASFDSFLDNQKQRAALGEDLVDEHEMLVLPGQQYDVTETMTSNAPYLGVVALFRTPAPQRWRFVYDAKASVATGITLGAHACALSSTAGKLLTDLSTDPASLASVHCPDLPE